MKIIFYASAFLCLALVAEAQYVSHISYPDTSQVIIKDSNDISVILSSEIKAEDIKAHLEVLASDKFEGRETGQNSWPDMETLAEYGQSPGNNPD